MSREQASAVPTTGIAQTIAALKAALAPASGEAASTGSPQLVQSQRMCLRVGSLQLLLPADGGREVIAPPAICRLPHTAPWLRGLANVRGNLVPVLDLTAALQATTDRASGQEYLLILGEGEAVMGVLIHGLPRLVNLADAERSAVTQPVSPLLEGARVATYERDGQVWIDVDFKALFDAIARHIAV